MSALAACTDAWVCPHVATPPTPPYLTERETRTHSANVIAFPDASEAHRRAIARARAEHPGRAREVQLREQLSRRSRRGRWVA